LILTLRYSLYYPTQHLLAFDFGNGIATDVTESPFQRPKRNTT